MTARVIAGSMGASGMGQEPRTVAAPATGPGGARIRGFSLLCGVLAPIACFGFALWIGIFERYGGGVYTYALFTVLWLLAWLVRGSRGARYDAFLAGILALGGLAAVAFALLFTRFGISAFAVSADLHDPSLVPMGVLALLPIPGAAAYLIQARRAFRSAQLLAGRVPVVAVLAGVLSPVLLTSGVQLSVWSLDHVCAQAMLSGKPAELQTIEKWRPLASILPLTEVLEEYARDTEGFTRSTTRSQGLELAYAQFKGIDHLQFKSQHHAGRFGHLREW